MNDAEKKDLRKYPGGGGGVGKTRYISHIGMCRPKGYGFWTFWSENGCKFFLWNRLWFMRELRECRDVFIVSIPSEKERNRNMRIRNAFE